MESRSVEDLKREMAAEAAKVAKSYKATFSTDAGRKVLEIMVNNFIMTNETALNSPNINYESAYKAGEAGVVKHILNQLKKAETL